MKTILSLVFTLSWGAVCFGQGGMQSDSNFPDRINFTYSASFGDANLSSNNSIESYMMLPFRTAGFDSAAFGIYKRIDGQLTLLSSFRFEFQSEIYQRIFISLGLEYNWTFVGGQTTGGDSTGVATQGAPFLHIEEKYSNTAVSLGLGYDFIKSKRHDLLASIHWTGGSMTWTTESYLGGPDREEPSEVLE